MVHQDVRRDRSETLAVLPAEIATLRGEGYQFVTVRQMPGDQLIYRQPQHQHQQKEIAAMRRRSATVP